MSLTFNALFRLQLTMRWVTSPLAAKGNNHNTAAHDTRLVPGRINRIQDHVLIV
jgi:hypothetical protein